MSKNFNSIKGLIFDLDGTLYRMQWYMRPLITIAVFPYCLRLPRFLKIRNQFAGKDLNSRDHLLSEICKQLSAAEHSSEETILNWIVESFYPAFTNTMRFLRNSRPQLDQTLTNLRNSNIKLAVLSDFDHVQQRLINLSINPENFHTIASSEAAGALKPSPRPFLEIAEKWNISPSEIVVIGDRDDTDGEAARRASMQFWQINDSKPAHNNTSWPFIRNSLLGLCN
ncbi:MAG: HAD family hydrolase [Fibrobacter sp.]|nr:HAD family hydrolase [Fibrobacter sp.]